MPYQLSRRARNAAAYSDRRVNVGKPHASLPAALRAAAECHEGDIHVTDTTSGEWARVYNISEYHNWRGTQRSPHVVLELPSLWAAELLGGSDRP